MTSTLNTSGVAEEFYSDDEKHPIPRIGVIDVVTALESGGAYYSLVIASPISGDERSQKRLLRKIENYIGDFYSPVAIETRGSPTPKIARIRVAIHADSDPVIFRLLDKCRDWVGDNKISFVIDSNLGEI